MPQVTPEFRDPSLPMARRADDLLARLTADEKIAMLHQRSPATERLGLAEWHTGQEALHGVAWRGPATVFPQAVGLGATWDPGLLRQVGAATAREVRAKHDENPLVSLNVWAPVVNLLRDPRWGRNEEGYSEDPLLTAQLATAYCRGLRGDHETYLRTAPTLKHFLAHNNETDRTTTSSSVRPRVLHEYDTRPFRGPIEAGAATGLMPAYNLVNGRPNHVSPHLALARTWADEELLICSDAWAPSNLVNTEHYFPDHPAAHAAALRAGLDSFTDHDGDGSFTVGHLTAAAERGLITMADVDRAVRRKLLIRLRLGEFDPDGGPFAGDGAGALHHPDHQRLARTAAARAIVLLRDEPGLLPLSPAAGTTIAVLGPLSRSLHEDWYSGTLPYQVTVADGLAGLGGPTLTGTEGLDRVAIEGLGEFDVADWGDEVITLRSAADGRYLTVSGDTGEVSATAAAPNGWVVHETFTRTWVDADTVLLRCTATGRYVTASGSTVADPSPLRWTPVADGVAAAAAAAKDADVAVVVAGNHPLINGRETQDRTTLRLPPHTRRLIRAVTDANPRTVLVLMSSYPFIVPAQARTVLWTSHGGQETGHAVADVLTGAQPPSGRLAQTWYRSDSDLPDIGEYDIIGSRRTYLYFDGTPLFGFGHGLTYTTFGYANLRCDRSPDRVTARADVTNTGSRPGSEVVQVYVRPSPPDPSRPRRRLAGFTRLTLAPGQTGTATVEFPLSELAMWDVHTHSMTVPAGDYEVLAGASSEDIRLAAVLTIDGPAPGPRCLNGRVVPAADFDDAGEIVLTDQTIGSGDAVTPVPAQPAGWLSYRDAQLGAAGPGRATFAVAGGRGVIEVRYAGDLLGVVTVPGTGGKYDWTEVTTPVALPGGAPRDLRLVLSGEVRLAWFRFDPAR